MLKTLLNFFQKQPSESQGKVPEGYCPNCWGEQEYDKQIRDLYVDKQININNHEENHAFIQEFIVSHINGIKLKKGNNSFECPRCKREFKA